MQLGSLPLVQQTSLDAAQQATLPRMDQKQGAAQTAEASALQDRAASIPSSDSRATDKPENRGASRTEDRGLGAFFRASEPTGNAALTSAVMATLATDIATGASQPGAGAGTDGAGFGPGAQSTALKASVERAQAARSSESERAVLEQSERQSANTSAALADTQAAFRAGTGYTAAARALAETTKLQTTRTDFFEPRQEDLEARAAEQSSGAEAAPQGETAPRSESRALGRPDAAERVDLGLDRPAARPDQAGTQGANSPVERAYREAAALGGAGNAAAEQMGQMAGPTPAQAAAAMRAG